MVPCPDLFLAIPNPKREWCKVQKSKKWLKLMIFFDTFEPHPNFYCSIAIKELENKRNDTSITSLILGYCIQCVK